jgi:hypothetical protein
VTHQEKIIDRVKKLLALGESDNPNESAAAMAAAQRLMTEHAIEQAMLDTTEEKDDEQVVDFSDREDALNQDKRYVNWKGQLAVTLSDANGCHCWRNQGRLHLVGRPSDVATVRYFFAYCVREIDRLVKLQGRGHGRTWMNNYRHGVVDAIRIKVRAEKKDLVEEMRSKATGMSLVVVNNAIAKVEERAKLSADHATRIHKLRKARSSYSRLDRSARDKGRQDGRNINLSSGKGLGAGASKKLGQ